MKEGNRVKVLKGTYEGKTGTISIIRPKRSNTDAAGQPEVVVEMDIKLDDGRYGVINESFLEVIE